MGNETSSEDDKRARWRMVSYKQFVRDLKHLNAIWSANVHTRPTLHPRFN